MESGHIELVWENEPSDRTPINEENLNKMVRSVNTVDENVQKMETTKFDKSEANLLVKSITFNRSNGVFTIRYYNNTTVTIDTMLEKIMVNFTYDPQTQRLIITLDDGTKQYVDLSALITQYEFLDSETIAFTLNSDGKVTAKVKEGSIQEKHLRPNYLADIKVEVSKAQNAANNAEESKNNAESSQENAALSAVLAAEHASAAYDSKENAKKSETNAKASENNAKSSADTAALSATLAAEHASSAYDSRTVAERSETNAASSKTEAAGSAAAAAQKATDASNYSDKAKSYAVGGTGTRENEDSDNAKYYYEQVKNSASGAGALNLKGKILFSQIPTTGNKRGDMYDISEKFVTDSRFLEGAGYSYPAGTNIYWTTEGKWDCLAGAEKMELTQAQYNALSSAEKTNGTVYYITDADDTIPPASGVQAGLMQPEDKEKLDGIEPGATRVVVDSELLALSENPVQNKVVKAALDNKANAASPTLTGTPKAPTASSGTNNTQIATTEFANSAVSIHNSSPTAHSDIRSLITGLTNRLNALADSDDTTLDQLSEIVAYIKSNRTLIESVTTSKVNVSDIVDNLTSTSANKPLSAKQGKTLKDLINSLESSAPSASLTIPKEAGTANAGEENTYARGDHVHPAQTYVTGNAGTATRLSNTRSINGMGFNGSANRTNYGTCSTAAATAAKTVSCTGFSLITGAEITIKFSYTNTADNPTLNVTSTGAKPIYYHGSAIPAGYLEANKTYTFRYNGTQWDLVGDVEREYYGVCTDADAVNAKSVSIPGFELKEGARVIVKFKNGNNQNDFKLNVNNKGSKNVLSLDGKMISKGEVCEFIYSGGSYIMLAHGAVRRITAALGTPGWYRFASLNTSSGSAILQIDRRWGNTGNPRSDILTVAAGPRKVSFTQIGGYGTAIGIDKVRSVSIDSSDIAYLEIHYTLNTRNLVEISAYPSNQEMAYLEMIGFTPGEIPSGYTSEEFVLSKYNGGMKASVFEGGLSGGNVLGSLKMGGWSVEYSGGSTHLSGAQGSSAINFTGSPGTHEVFHRGLSKNGRFMDCVYSNGRYIEYMSEETIAAGSNTPKKVTLMDESGNSYFNDTYADSFYIRGKGNVLPAIQLTQAEYNALPNEKNSNNIIYFITDAN